MSAAQWRRPFTMAVAAALALALLYYSLRDVNWREFAGIVSGASPTGLILTAAIGTCGLLLRALRWRILLNAEGTVSVRTAFLAIAAGFFGNSFLPARAGDLVRTFMISSRYPLDSRFVLTTALAERVVDGVALVVIASAILLTVPLPLGWLAGALKPVAVLGLIGVLVIALAPLLSSVGTTVFERLTLPEPLRRWLRATLEQCLRGMRAFHDGRRLMGFVGLTALIWCVDAVGTVVGGAALGLDIPVAAAFLLLAGLGMASALPSMPGFVGIYQFAAVSALTPFGFSRTDSIAYILVVQALMTVVMGIFGSVGLFEYRRSKVLTDMNV